MVEIIEVLKRFDAVNLIAILAMGWVLNKNFNLKIQALEKRLTVIENRITGVESRLTVIETILVMQGYPVKNFASNSENKSSH